jgi:hypothetical protein
VDYTCFFVQVLQCLGDLDDGVSRKILGKVGQADDLVEQLATGTQLEDDVVVLLGFGEVDEFDNVGVVELAHDLDFLEDIGSLWGITSVPVLQRLERVLCCAGDGGHQCRVK